MKNITCDDVPAYSYVIWLQYSILKQDYFIIVLICFIYTSEIIAEIVVKSKVTCEIKLLNLNIVGNLQGPTSRATLMEQVHRPWEQSELIIDLGLIECSLTQER